MKSLFGAFKGWVEQIKEGAADWDELEAVLIQSDLGYSLVDRIMARLKDKRLNAKTVREETIREISSLWREGVRELRLDRGEMQVWLIVGVNGVGKTTSIAKLAHRYLKQGKRVHLVAADTFRAGAIEQLKIWADRLGVSISLGREGGDPAAAAYEGIEDARAQGADLVLIDTAGRLHNKDNLMRELQKTKRVVSSRQEGAPHETLLVLDATNGGNSLNQAEQFHKGVEVSGVIMTKLDSSSKGGIVASLKEDQGLDTLLVGSGERVEDLEAFEPRAYVERFFG